MSVTEYFSCLYLIMMDFKQYATIIHDFEKWPQVKFMSNVHDDISVGENCIKTQIPIQQLSRSEPTESPSSLQGT